MPFKSASQRRKFGELVKQGKLSQNVFDEWNSATGDKKLPERLPAKAAPKKTKRPSPPKPVRPKWQK
jgi:hypothetical protein